MDDERLTKIQEERQNSINQSNNVYNTLLQDNQNMYNQQNAYAEEFERTQNDLLDKQLKIQEDQINKQKEIARENKAIEDKKALNDYTAYNNPYGYNSEKLAEQGLNNSGVSETSKLGSFNIYQNRLAASNKVMQDAFVQYDKEMDDARLNNDVQKAQNALSKLQMQLQYADSFMNNKANISMNQLNNNQNLDTNYFNRYQTEYQNIQNEKEREEANRQWEKEFAEKQRQFNESMAYQKAKDRASSQPLLIENTLNNGKNSWLDKANKLISTFKGTNSSGKSQSNTVQKDASSIEYNAALNAAKQWFKDTKGISGDEGLIDLLARTNLSDKQIEQVYKEVMGNSSLITSSSGLNKSGIVANGWR